MIRGIIHQTRVEGIGTVGTKRALERTDERPARLRRQVCAAALAVGPHLKHNNVSSLADATHVASAQNRRQPTNNKDDEAEKEEGAQEQTVRFACDKLEQA